VHGIDPVARRVETDAGSYDADVLVVALGADLHPDSVPGLLDGGHDFYTVSGAFAARQAVASFAGGRVVVAVTSTPFKCPPAPSETALLMHDYLTRHGLRDRTEISLVMPLPKPIPPSPVASDALLAAFAERGIEWLPNRLVRSIDPARKVAVCSDGEELPFDLFLGAPAHRVPQVVAESGMTVDGWIPVDPLTLETKFAGVYAIGDVTSVGTPKAGVFAEGQAVVVADRIAAQVEGRDPDAEYSGTGICYVEYGGERIGRVEVTFRAGQPPVGDFGEPTEQLAADKTEFGRARVARWFGRDWTPLGA
jgi:sulfide:quinone oxidoreductase